MKNQDRQIHFRIATCLFVVWVALLSLPAWSQAGDNIPLIQIDDLVKTLKSPGAAKPLILQVGSHVLYSQAHIAGSEYVGAGSTDDGIQALRKRLASVPKNKAIVIYCGCCPWSHCPNIKPAAEVLRAMGFSNFKALYIPDNLGTDWVNKGYPTAQGG